MLSKMKAAKNCMLSCILSPNSSPAYPEHPGRSDHALGWSMMVMVPMPKLLLLLLGSDGEGAGRRLHSGHRGCGHSAGLA
jgi:hypothetical protein